ncbi:hypothetical protein AaE_001641 [Aphanomyces astaci]|uniref:MIT domain-containing protein n=1 Tax=Aphanomyces astaci TaxID=112090 RepID=A0A6A5AWL7_APHAT|nr:hypothetical protein AaE_001641 [Aphanomyces astaci]
MKPRTSLPSSTSAAHFSRPPQPQLLVVQELDEDDWEDDQDCSDVVVSIAPKQLASPQVIAMASTDKSSESKTCIDQAIALKRKALDMEKSRAFQEAMELYADAGHIFLRVGRSCPSGSMQNALKMEAFSLLTQAERLARWIENSKFASCRESVVEYDSQMSMLAAPHMRHVPRCSYSQQTPMPGSSAPRP